MTTSTRHDGEFAILGSKLAELQCKAAARPDTPHGVLMKLAKAGRSDVHEALISRYVGADGELRLDSEDAVELVCCVLRNRRKHLPHDRLARRVARAIPSVADATLQSRLRELVADAVVDAGDQEYESAVVALEQAYRRAKSAPALLQEACWQTQALGWGSAAVYRYNSRLKVLELVTSTGPSVSLVHSLGSERACDIEALVFRRGEWHIHRGGGCRPHYSEYIYRAMGHERFRTRLFAVIGIVLDSNGIPVRGALEWELVSGDMSGDPVWAPRVPVGCRFEPMGTMSLSSEQTLGQDQIDRTLRMLDGVGVLAFEAQLRSLASTVHREVSRLSKAERTSLYLFPEWNALDLLERDRPLPYAVCYDGDASRWVRRDIDGAAGGARGSEDPFLPDGLGVEVLRVGEAIVFESSGALAIASERLKSRSVTVYPLQDGLGLFYAHDAPPESADRVSSFLRRASHAISMALLEESQVLRRRRLDTVVQTSHDLSASLDDRARAEHVANFALRFLGADVVAVMDGDTEAVAGQLSSYDWAAARRLARHAGGFEVIRSQDGSEMREVFDDQGAASLLEASFVDPRQSYRRREDIAVTVVIKRPGRQVMILDFRHALPLSAEDRRTVLTVAQLCEHDSLQRVAGVAIAASVRAARVTRGSLSRPDISALN